jgi:hypothetical protein
MEIMWEGDYKGTQHRITFVNGDMIVQWFQDDGLEPAGWFEYDRYTDDEKIICYAFVNQYRELKQMKSLYE